MDIEQLKEYFVRLLQAEMPDEEKRETEEKREKIIEKAAIIADWVDYIGELDVAIENKDLMFFNIIEAKMIQSAKKILFKYVKFNAIQRFSPDTKIFIRKIQLYLNNREK